jgi:hypothetical protein
MIAASRGKFRTCDIIGATSTWCDARLCPSGRLCRWIAAALKTISIATPSAMERPSLQPDIFLTS